MRILWISRHVPQPAQISELERAFGEIEIIQRDITLDDNPENGANQVAALIQETGATEVVGVMPVSHLAALCRRGIRPLRAVMERRPTSRVLENGEKEYIFEHQRFERVLEVSVRVEPLFSQPQKENSHAPSAPSPQ
ncbi:MAG: hypothetical protein QXU79_02330 [Candidatus Micrarchaeaceae archaeon]